MLQIDRCKKKYLWRFYWI